MDKLRLGPPLDRQFLRKLATALRQEGWVDASDITGWLARYESGEQMVAAVCSAWSRTSLPLRDWATRVDDVEVWFKNNDLRLAVHVSDDPEVIVWQAAPLEPMVFEAMAAAFPQALPTMLTETALSAPGMVVDWFGPLVAPLYLARRLGYVTSWAEGIGQEECERLGFEYPDPKRHLVEVVDNGLGDCYVLGTDGTVYFFDHDACGLVRCSIALERLVEEYFASPQGILDPYERKWAEQPRETPRAEPLPDPPALVLSRKGKQLSHLAGIALAVRGCLRAMPGEHLPDLPRGWARGNAALLEIIARCERVAAGGKPLSEDDAAKAHSEMKRVWTSWNVRVKWEGRDYWAGILVTYAMPALVRACSAPADVAAVHEAVVWCGRIMTSRASDDSAALAGIHDSNYLLSLRLGAPGTMGMPVPSEFFDRPLWLNGSPSE
jgi:hypothetical protein